MSGAASNHKSRPFHHLAASLAIRNAAIDGSTQRSRKSVAAGATERARNPCRFSPTAKRAASAVRHRSGERNATTCGGSGIHCSKSQLKMAPSKTVSMDVVSSDGWRRSPAANGVSVQKQANTAASETAAPIHTHSAGLTPPLKHAALNCERPTSTKAAQRSVFRKAKCKAISSLGKPLLALTKHDQTGAYCGLGVCSVRPTPSAVAPPAAAITPTVCPAVHQVLLSPAAVPTCVFPVKLVIETA